MARMFRGRASYKTSDVAALFILGMLLSVVGYLILILLEMAYNRLFAGAGTPCSAFPRIGLALLVLATLPATGGEPRKARTPAEVADGLRSPEEKYAPVDWANLPPWRQASFFGVRSQGQVFVYVVDCSGSMDGGDRMTRAKAELRKSIGTLRFPQRFHVIFYNDRPITMPGGIPRSADGAAKLDFNAWLRSIEPEGETDPRAAMGQAPQLPARRRLPALRRGVPARDRRGHRQDEPPQGADPLRRPVRGRGRRPVAPDRGRLSWPVRGEAVRRRLTARRRRCRRGCLGSAWPRASGGRRPGSLGRAGPRGAWR